MLRARRTFAALVAALALTTTTHAALAPTKASQLVTVYTTGGCPLSGFSPGSSASFGQMVRADGSTAPFAIPAKQVFVLTDVTMIASNEPAGDSVFAILAVGTAAGGSPVATRFETVTSTGTVTSTFTFPTGIAVRGATSACIELIDLTHLGSTFPSAIAHGFFAPDK